MTDRYINKGKFDLLTIAYENTHLEVSSWDEFKNEYGGTAEQIEMSKTPTYIFPAETNLNAQDFLNLQSSNATFAVSVIGIDGMHSCRLHMSHAEVCEYIEMANPYDEGYINLYNMDDAMTFEDFEREHSQGHGLSQIQG